MLLVAKASNNVAVQAANRQCVLMQSVAPTSGCKDATCQNKVTWLNSRIKFGLACGGLHCHLLQKLGDQDKSVRTGQGSCLLTTSLETAFASHLLDGGALWDV